MKAKDFFEKVAGIRSQLKSEDLEKPLAIWLTAADDYANNIADNCPPVELRDIILQINDQDVIQMYLDW